MALRDFTQRASVDVRLDSVAALHVRLVRVVRYCRPVLVIVTLALAFRLAFLSTSIDEVDSANFVNALANGFDVPLLRPHAPGYPVYVALGSIVNAAVGDPLLSLTLVSAFLGSFALIPFYYLARDLLGPRLALAGALLLAFNPMYWAYSETALSDIPSAFFAVTLAWLAFRSMRSRPALLWSAVVLALAIGVRPANVALVLLPGFVLVRGMIATRDIDGRTAFRWLAIFLATMVAWIAPAVLSGSSGLADYFTAVDKQWSTAVTPYDIRHVESPWLPNALYRVERFTAAYLFTYPWSGSDERTALSALLAVPWTFGLGLFAVGFRVRNPGHLMIALWAASLLYPIVSLHFLPRYMLAQLPALIIAAVMGYHFLATELWHSRYRVEVLSGAGVGTLLILLGIKYQPPVGAFEFTPPSEGYLGGVLFAAGIGAFLATGLLCGRQRRRDIAPFKPETGAHTQSDGTLLAGALMLLVVPFAVVGFGEVSTAHRAMSPAQQLVEHVRSNFDSESISVCWDNQTHSYFEVLMPGVVPTGYWSYRGLEDALLEGRKVIATDRCVQWARLEGQAGVERVAIFDGDSLVWSKAPSIELYVATYPTVRAAP